jgi:ABC-type multidrug transport system fused ATPase/permease subunit
VSFNNFKIGKKYFIDPLGKKNYVILLTGILIALYQIAEIVLPGKIINTLYPDVHIKSTILMISFYVMVILTVPYISEILNRKLQYYNMTVIDLVKEKLLGMQLTTNLLMLEKPEYTNDIDFGSKCLERNFYLKFSNTIISFVTLLFLMVASTCVVREKKIILFCIFTNAVLLPFYYYFQMKMNKNTFEEQLNNNTERREMEAIQWNMLDLRFAQEIRCFNLMKFMTGKYNSCREFVYGERKKYCKKNIKYAIIPAVVFGIQMFLSYYIAGDLLLKHRIDVGDFIIYAGGIWGIASGGRAFVEKLVLLKNENMYLGALGKCFLYEAQETDNTGKLSVEAFESIEFENVSFSYNSDDNYAICNLNVRITAGDKISIVGENGSGKSTFIKLLLGLYTPTKGTVYLNGKDIQLYDREQVKKLFATIFQDYMVTSYTIANNITFDDTVDETRMNVCLEMAGLREKIDSLPKGANTNVFFKLSNEGTELSGGEMQKLAMSRVYYKDAPFFILDEPAASLSPKAELELYNKMWSMSSEKTVLLISHRLSSCCDAKKILVFKNGKIEEIGNHKELMEKQDYYFELFSKQAENYK